MNKKERNFTNYVYILLWIIWAGTFLFGARLIYFNYSTQNRYLRVEAIQIDFESPQRQVSGYTIGGFISDATVTAPLSGIAANTECSGDANNVESDIILPTHLIPVNIGRLEYNNGSPRLQLNDCIDYGGNNDKLLSRVVYPRVLVGGKITSEKTIPYDALRKNIVISYAVRENQEIEIRLEPVGSNNKKYKLFITPHPNQLQYVFREDSEQQTTKFNFIYGKKIVL